MTRRPPEPGSPTRAPVGAPVTHAHRREPAARAQDASPLDVGSGRRWRFTSAVEAARHLGAGDPLQAGSG